MKRYVVLIVIVSAVLIAAFSFGVLTDNAFGQDKETPAQRMQRERREQAESMSEKIRNMSPEERDKFRAEIREKSKKFENMSDEERKKLRADMSDRFTSRDEGMSRQQQLAKIAGIEKQLAKLKVAVESIDPDARSKFRDLSEAERTKLREKMSRAMMERQMIIRDIEQQLANLKGSRRPPTVSEARISELRAIHKLAVKEKATQTADRLDKLIMGVQRGSVGRDRPPERGPREGQERPRRERPPRQEKTE